MRSSLRGQSEVPWTSVNAENPSPATLKCWADQHIQNYRPLQLLPLLQYRLFPPWPWWPPEARVTTPRAFLGAGQCLEYWSHWNYLDFRATCGKVAMRNISHRAVPSHMKTCTEPQKGPAIMKLPRFLMSEFPFLLKTNSRYCWLPPSHTILSLKCFYIFPWIHSTGEINEFEEEKEEEKG